MTEFMTGARVAIQGFSGRIVLATTAIALTTACARNVMPKSGPHGEKGNSPAAGLAGALFSPAAFGATGAAHYASPSGLASGDGSLARPWDIVTALGAGTRVAAGDV